ncbi:MAG: hypothetical protein LBQ97_06675 [Fusobacteriaceae bacterium]|nr:hypothetical protein [Fusobacteriaceae bacterium]
MEKNIRVIAQEDEVELKIFNINGFELILIFGLIFVVFEILSILCSDPIYIYFKEDIIFLIKIGIIVKIIEQLSYNAFEKMIISENRIEIQYYFAPFLLRLYSIAIPNNKYLQTVYNGEPFEELRYKVIDKLYTISILHRFFPKIFGKFIPGTLYGINPRFLFVPSDVRGMHLKFNGKIYSFGAMLTKPDYDEILALILAQRAKWEKEHPEDAIAPEPEEAETHAVDSPSQ